MTDLIEDEEGELPPDAPPDASDRRWVKSKAKAKKDREKNIREFMQAALNTQAGRDFLAWLMLERCGLHRQSAVASFDANALHFREGARQVAVELHHLALLSNKTGYMMLLGESLGD